MFHKAIDLKLLEGTTLEVRFQDGKVKRLDMSSLFDKIPALKALSDRELFMQGRLISPYGIIWNDDVDIETETIYNEGKTTRREKSLGSIQVANAILAARAQAGLSQIQLAAKSGIDQADISKIERGLANPSISTLERLAQALGGSLSVNILFHSAS